MSHVTLCLNENILHPSTNTVQVQQFKTAHIWFENILIPQIDHVAHKAHRTCSFFGGTGNPHHWGHQVLQNMQYPNLDTTCAYLCLSSTSTTSLFLFRFSSSGINICCTSPLVDIRKLYTVTLGRTSNLTTFAQVSHPWTTFAQFATMNAIDWLCDRELSFFLYSSCGLE